MNVNIFIDMDGVLAEYDPQTSQKMYDKDFFLKRPVMTGNVEFVKKLLKEGENVYILTSILADQPYIVKEKHDWLDKHLNISMDRRLFVPYGYIKKDYVLDKVQNANSKDTLNILVDDFSKNLFSWDNGKNFIAIKMLNEVNNSTKSWVNKHKEKVIYHNDSIYKKENTIKKLVKRGKVNEKNFNKKHKKQKVVRGMRGNC